MSDTPGGDTQVIPRHPCEECYFFSRKKDDIIREYKEHVYDVLDSRDLSRKEEKVIKEVATEVFNVILPATLSTFGEKMDKKKNDNFSRIIAIVSSIVAVLALMHTLGVFG